MVFTHVLTKEEKILWQEKPNFILYMLSSLSAVIFGLVWLTISLSIGVLGNNEVSRSDFSSTKEWIKEVLKKDDGRQVVLIPFVLIGGLFISSPVFKLLAYSKEGYALTDKRILLSSGIIGQDIKSIDYVNVKNLEVNVGPLDKLFNTGKIYIFSGEIITDSANNPNKDAFLGIQEPYKIFNLIRDQKTTV